MSDQARADLCQQLRRFIAWEVEAQVGSERPVEQMSPLVADTAP